MTTLTFFADDQRHLVCLPYSIPNLHQMAAALGIKRCWLHRDHYDIPKRRIAEITAKCELVGSVRILEIIGAARKRPRIKRTVAPKIDR